MPPLRGREGYWAWLLNRISGLGVLLFLALHVFDTLLVGFGPAVYDHTIQTLYRNPLARLGEVVLVAALVYHSANGLRIIVLDFWDGAARRQRQLWYAAWGLFAIVFLPAAAVMLRPIFMVRGG
jgi:succinate dehydrogenase / fumarate reductase, cytochrome b subunit